MHPLLNYEIWIRLSSFLSILLLMGFLERIIPKRKLSISKPRRWLNNLGLIVLNSIILRLIFPTAAVGVALWADDKHIGLFHLLNLPFYLTVFITVIAMDLTIYLQHVIFHYVPWLWRIHRVHHIDQDIDVTTGLRFHPFEIILSLLIKFAFILLVGAPALGVMIFEVLLNATSMFNHSNINLPFKLDKYLCWFIVTPDMHRVHHSSIIKETNSNFGFNLPIWDRLFGTYKAQPQKGHQSMQIGLTEYRNQNLTQKIMSMLIFPFKK